MNYTNYELSKKLAKFMGKDSPEPIDGETWVEWKDGEGPTPYVDSICKRKVSNNLILTNAYTLEDVLSKPFCEALVKVFNTPDNAVGLNSLLSCKYYYYGFEGVEKALEQIMEEK